MRQTGVAISSTDCISSGVDAGLQLVTVDRGEHRLDVLHEVERLGVEQHVLLLDPERVRRPGAEAMLEHAAAVGGALARDRRRDRLARVGVAHALQRLGFDLDLPGRVEQPSDDCRRRRPNLSEDLPVGARDLLVVGRVGEEDPRAHDVGEGRVGAGKRLADDLQAEPGLLVRGVGWR